MPELPEVETIKNALAPWVVGRNIVRVDLLWKRMVQEPSVKEFETRLARKQILNIRRRGKYLLLDLLHDEILILHLKMSGVLLLQPSEAKIQKHTRAIFRLEGETDLHFIDQRKFGSIWLVEDEARVVGKLGLEPFGTGFTPEFLRQASLRHNVPIKAFLVDQSIIAGIGNMWADESLFAAGIHPLKPANRLSDSEIERLHRAILEVLERGIRNNGASVDTYQLPDGSTGNAHTEFRVAHRRGESCHVCGSPLCYLKVRGRGTCFCPNCQPEEAN